MCEIPTAHQVTVSQNWLFNCIFMTCPFFALFKIVRNVLLNMLRAMGIMHFNLVPQKFVMNVCCLPSFKIPLLYWHVLSLTSEDRKVSSKMHAVQCIHIVMDLFSRCAYCHVEIHIFLTLPCPVAPYVAHTRL